MEQRPVEGSGRTRGVAFFVFEGGSFPKKMFFPTFGFPKPLEVGAVRSLEDRHGFPDSCKLEGFSKFESRGVDIGRVRLRALLMGAAGEWV